MKDAFAIVSIFFLAAACSPRKDANSQIKVTNGLTAKAEVAAFVPRISDRTDPMGKVSKCTSVAIGPNVLLTAAHCLAKGTNSLIEKNNRLTAAGVNSAYVVAAPTNILNKAGGRQFTGLDFIVVVMNKKAFDQYRSIDTTKERKAGVRVIVAGYGGNDAEYPGTTEGVLRIGENELTVPDMAGTLALKGLVRNVPGGATGESSATARGDSGGPLFDFDAEVALGITSSGRIEKDEKWSFFADVSSQTSRYMLCAAVADAGAVIPSLRKEDCAEFKELSKCRFVVPDSDTEPVSMKC